jgi:hypothetical protein
MPRATHPAVSNRLSPHRTWALCVAAAGLVLLTACGPSAVSQGGAARPAGPGTEPTIGDFSIDDVAAGAPGRTYADPEFQSSVHRMVYQNSQGGVPRVFMAELDPRTGLLRAAGPDVPVDEGVASLGPERQTNNGPEWGQDREGVAVFYSKPDDSGVVQLWRASFEDGGISRREQITRVAGEGGRGVIQVTVRQDVTRTSTLFAYRYASTPHGVGPSRWADEAAPDEVNDIPFFNTAAFAPSWIPGTDDFLYSRIVSAGRAEIARYSTASRSVSVLTSDPASRRNILAVAAPELDGELVIAAVRDSRTLTVYRSGVSGYFPWLDLRTPDGDRPFLVSPEPFAAGGTSYFAVQACDEDPDTTGGLPPSTDCAMWVLGLGAGGESLARRVDAGALSGARAFRYEPEPYLGQEEVFLFYNVGGELRRARTGVRLPR